MRTYSDADRLRSTHKLVKVSEAFNAKRQGLVRTALVLATGEARFQSIASHLPAPATVTCSTNAMPLWSLHLAP